MEFITNKKDSMINLLTTEELAEILKVKKSSIEQAISQKRMKIPYIKVGKFTRFQVEDVKEYLQNQKIKPVK